MNGGIIRNALTTTLALEREHREPSIVREIAAESNQLTELQSPQRLFEDEFAYLLSVILKGRRVS